MKTKRNIVYIALTVISLILSVVCCVIAFVVIDALSYSYTENNTKKIEATYKCIEKNKQDYLISVNEFDIKLLVNYKTIVDNDLLNALTVDETINFRINENLSVEMLSNAGVSQTIIYSLSSNGGEIVTLESTNEFGEKQNKNIRLTAIIFFVLFLMIAIFSIIMIIRNGLYNKKLQASNKG